MLSAKRMRKQQGYFLKPNLRYASDFIRYKPFLMGNEKYVIQYICTAKRIVLNYAIRSQKARQEQQMFITLENIIRF
jgi:hypothetical protein